MTAEPRIFSTDEADRALPLVRRIVLDLQSEYPRWREAVGRFELASVGHDPGAAESGELVACQREVTERAERISGYLTELDQVGCVFKGFEAGLVDFYSLREDRLVFLCWRLGEARVTQWHELDAGYAGRRPINQPSLTGSRS
ncbi:MAG TPA: DUF2203 domain-containing protein [Gemmatimonadales bacterium]|nr:DUF2203 domain-containing protein [Gemmatimonadales bacterium]